jgi:prepilin-type N-terminal cleavage/methylation domain-containing protein
MTKLECRMTKEAFTLLELLVAIAIIAALLGLAFPCFKVSWIVQKRCRPKTM